MVGLALWERRERGEREREVLDICIKVFCIQNLETLNPRAYTAQVPKAKRFSARSFERLRCIGRMFWRPEKGGG